jgi:protein-disulfide isomerase
MLFTFLLLALRKPSKEALPLWSLAVLWGAGYALAAVYFGYISVSKIHSYCILCLLTYGINFGLFFGSWLIRRRFSTASLISEIPIALRHVGRSRWLWGALSVTVTATALLILFIPHYWSYAPPPIDDGISHGITSDGHPWVGAEHPALTITEFSDYMCFQCKKMHFMLRRLVQSYPDRIRLVHRHFPMDHAYNPLVTDPFHSGSGQMAIIAIYAQTKGKFWEVNDMLFDIAATKQDFNTRRIAEFMGISSGEVVQALDSKNLRLMLKHDIAVGIQKGITGTPGFVIDDKVYLGNIPKEILETAIGSSTD